ncbi:MAG: flagella basal body P-ring formation protein FlgA [Paraglaciecola sp.]|jgi:flagella basal body P-ring formation protein FlgA
MKKSFISKTIIYFSAAALCNFSPLSTATENNISPQNLLELAEQYVSLHVKRKSEYSFIIKAMPIDSRLSIPECKSPLKFFASNEALNQSNITVKASCPDSNWYMFLVVRAKVMQPVVVISSAVSPGTVLSKQNIKLVEMEKRHLRTTTYADINKVIGARIKRRLRPGRPVQPNNLCFVCEGDIIIIKASSSRIQIKASGIALEDGNIGDTILVRNTRSKKQLDAQVISISEVKVRI